MAEEYVVVVSNLAKQDVRGIIHYLMTNYSKQTALKVTVAINDKIDDLKRMPGRHPKFERPGLKVKETYRWVASGKHQIVFRIERSDTQVTVARIFGAAMSDEQKIRRLEEE